MEVAFTKLRSKDQMYDEDDIVMPGEQQAAWRHSATPPPVGQPGKLLEVAIPGLP